MENISITIHVADRPYKLSVTRAEEERVRKAAGIINDKIRDYGKTYAYNDKQDLLAMAALQYTVAALKFEAEMEFRDNHLDDKLSQIDALLSEQTS
ncbi:MAG: cell division protein ZapA [Bacteroidales bacterium]|nr:cell division protein ZapA [Bacteroidales bacterium]